MDTILLNNKTQIPMQAFGVRGLTDPDICEQVCLYSIKSGFRNIDTSPLYHNEKSIGIVISECSVPRQELYISSKVYPRNYKKGVERSIEKTLKNLRTDYLDLLLIQTPLCGDWKNAWRAMERAVDEKIVRSIGVCNFITRHIIDELVNIANIPPCVDQVECHPFLQQNRLREKLNMENIRLEAWYPLGHGKSLLLNNPVLLDIATAHHTTSAQVILRWHLQMGNIAIVGSSNPDHIRRNLHLESFTLSPEDIELISSLDIGRNLYRMPKPLQQFGYSFAR